MKKPLVRWTLIGSVFMLLSLAAWFVAVEVDIRACHSLDRMSHMTTDDLSDCDRATLKSLSAVIAADRDKLDLFLRAAPGNSCSPSSLVYQFEQCTKPYLQAVRAEAMLNEHATKGR